MAKLSDEHYTKILEDNKSELHKKNIKTAQRIAKILHGNDTNVSNKQYTNKSEHDTNILKEEGMKSTVNRRKWKNTK